MDSTIRETHVTVTYHQDLAAEVIRALDEIERNLPVPTPSRATPPNFVRSHVNIPFDFLGSAIAAVDATPDLQVIHRLDVEHARETLQFIEAFRPVADRVDALQQVLRSALSSSKASLAADALQIYAIAKGFARDLQGTDSAVHVENMRRDLGRTGRRMRERRSHANTNAALLAD